MQKFKPAAVLLTVVALVAVFGLLSIGAMLPREHRAACVWAPPAPQSPACGQGAVPPPTVTRAGPSTRPSPAQAPPWSVL